MLCDAEWGSKDKAQVFTFSMLHLQVYTHTARSNKYYFKKCIYFILKWAVNLEAAVWLSSLRDRNTTCITALWELLYLHRVYRKETGNRIIYVPSVLCYASCVKS